MGRIKATDQDPHDQLYYTIVRGEGDANIRGTGTARTNVIQLELETGALQSEASLIAGAYTLNVSVSDGKFTTFSPVNIQVNNVEDQMVDNGVIIVLGGASPQDFLSLYRRSFVRAITNILDVRPSDVILLSIQHIYRRNKRHELVDSYRKKSTLERISDIGVLFCVRKGMNKYISRKQLFNRISTEISLIDSTIGLRVIRIEGNMCRNISCLNGYCKDVIYLTDSQVVIATEALNFVSMEYAHEGICVCPTGYAGKLCDEVLNQCAYNPCPKFKQCTPNESERGYSCDCPEGFVGSKCLRKLSDCVGYQNTPACYHSTNPITFQRNSLMHYNIRSDIGDKFAFSTWIRTVQSRGNILFISGKIDYGILEVGFGFCCKFRFSYINRFFSDVYSSLI